MGGGVVPPGPQSDSSGLPAKVLPPPTPRLPLQLTLLSRSLRLAGVAWCCYHTTGSDMARMLGSVKNKHRAKTGKILNLMRMLIVPPMAVFNHSLFTLPFAYVLPAQLWTFSTCAWMMRTSVCIVALQDENLQLSQRVCGVMRRILYNLSMLIGGPPQTAPGSTVHECGDVQGVVLVGLYLHVILLLVVPCWAVYFIELNLKLSFLKRHGLSLEHTWPLMDSSLIKAVIGYSAVVGSWMACEVAVLIMAPLHCNEQGLLTMSMAHL